MTVDGNTVHMSMPFAKVDEKKRLVSGFATLDNVDTQDDIVEAAASARAFARARGNIREMHQSIAVGKMVDFREKEFFDQTDNKFYRGIFVTARVSEGAEDTWKKVLDGTLTGFSIGGEINVADNEFNKDAGKSVRVIKDYDLVELSLVDNPANQLANVFSIQKSAGNNGSVKFLKGMVAETTLENVFVCKNDDSVLVTDADSEECPSCGNKMENAGWFESDADRAEKVLNLVNKFLNPSEKEAAPISPSEGGVNMEPETVQKSNDKVVNVVNPDEEETTPVAIPVEEDESGTTDADETASATEEEETESPAELPDEETEISKMINDLHDAVKTSLADVSETTSQRVEALEKKIDEATAAFVAEASELKSKMDGFGKSLETSKARLAELETRLEKVNASDAIRKSVDLEPEVTTVKNVQTKTSWNGAFSGNSNGFSVDEL